MDMNMVSKFELIETTGALRANSSTQIARDSTLCRVCLETVTRGGANNELT